MKAVLETPKSSTTENLEILVGVEAKNKLHDYTIRVRRESWRQE